MPSDENENKPPRDDLSPAPAPVGARWLAVVPVTAAILLMLLLMPRATAPEDIPLPRIDGKALEATRRDDTQRAAAARATRLPGVVLLVGSSLRALNSAQVKAAPPEDIGSARAALEHAFRTVANEEGGFESLRTLRALQLEAFLAEVERYESTGERAQELDELGGGFVERMGAAGWIDGKRVLLDDAQRRAAYKLVWAASIGAERVPQLALTLDEKRALYTLYLTQPHAPEAQRPSYESMRRSAANEAECKRANAQEKLDAELWRLEKVRRLGEFDPDYPTAYAVGVASFRAGRYDQASTAFQQWIEKHPDGPLSIRARNHLKASLTMYGPS